MTPPSESARQSLSSGNMADISSIEHLSGLSRPGSTMTSPQEGLTGHHSTSTTSATSASLSLSKSTSSAEAVSMETSGLGGGLKLAGPKRIIRPGRGRSRITGPVRLVSTDTAPIAPQMQTQTSTLPDTQAISPNQPYNLQQPPSTASSANCTKPSVTTSNSKCRPVRSKALKVNTKSNVAKKTSRSTPEESLANSAFELKKTNEMSCVSDDQEIRVVQKEQLTTQSSNILDPIPRLDTSPTTLITSDNIPCGQVNRSSISSFCGSESLFSSKSEISRRSSDSSKVSASLLSNISDGDMRIGVVSVTADNGGISAMKTYPDEHVFVRPDPPAAGGMHTRVRSLEALPTAQPLSTRCDDQENPVSRSDTETESEIAIPDTDAEEQTRRLAEMKKLRLESISMPSPSKANMVSNKKEQARHGVGDRDGERLTPELAHSEGNIR